jgi:small subunit ribosomal protein S20
MPCQNLCTQVQSWVEFDIVIYPNISEEVLANKKSAIKRIKQNDKRRLRNRHFRGTARRFVVRARTAMEGDDLEAARTATMSAVSALDKAAEKGVIHKNNASRRKGRLMKKLAQLEKAA